MAGRFVIRVDFRNGKFVYLSRDYRADRHPRRTWLMVQEPGDATRFWTREAAESAAFIVASVEYVDSYVSVREWDGNRQKNP